MQTTISSLPRGEVLDSRLVITGAGLFAIGVAATVTILILFGLGAGDLPVWLSAIAGITTPSGLAISVFAIFRQARRRCEPGAREQVDESALRDPQPTQ